MTEPITEFLNKHGIMWEPIALNKKVPTRIGDYKPDPKDYELTEEVIKSRQNTPSEYIAIFTNKIAQYDIDIEDYIAHDKFKELPYFKSVSKKLPHYFCYVSDTTNNRHCPVAGDLLCGQWSYCKRTEVVYNANNEIKKYSLSDFETRININKFNAVLKKLKSLVDNYDYDTWLKVCFGLYNTAIENLYKDPISYVIEFSKDGKGYDDKAKQTINNLKYKQDGVKFGTLVDLVSEQPAAEKAMTKKKKKEVISNVVSSEYEEWKKQWEEHVFSCKQRNLVCHDLYSPDHITEAPYSSLYFVNDNNFVEMTMRTYQVNENSELCIKRWNLDPNKREYMDYNFAPYPFVVSNGYNYYNTWKDFEFVNYVPTNEIDPEHAVKVYCDFKNHMSSGDPAVYDYLLQLDAHTAQFPGEKPGVCVVICGLSGTGKGTDSVLKQRIFGEDLVFQTSDISQVLGQFTGSISKKLIVILDEAVPKNMFEKDGPLKSLITEPFVKIERKGKDSIQENSFVRLVISTNSDNVVKVSNSDRRMVVISPKVYVAKEYEKFPHNIFDLINSKDSCKHVFDYLRTIKVKYRNVQQWQFNRPITEEYREMQEASIPTHIQFLINFVSTNEVDKLEFTISQALLYEHFKNYVSDNSKFELSLMAFCRKVKKIESVKAKQTRVGGVSSINYNINKLSFFGEMEKLNYKIRT